MSEIIIVTRHPGTTEWLNRQGIYGKVLDRARRIDVEGKIVIGVLPIKIAAAAKKIFMVEVVNVPSFDREYELSADELEAYGAHIVCYKVERMPYETYPTYPE